VGADSATDADVLLRSEQLYGGYKLRRVYYSAFSPIPDSSSVLPSQRPHLMREHRLYEADWLMRHYGFEREEIVSAAVDGMLDPAIDPKLAWALQNRDRFPVDVNAADRELMLRIPGLGVKSVNKLLAVRRLKRLTVDDLVRVGGAFRRMKPFVVTDDWRPTTLTDTADLPEQMRELSKHAQPRQLELF
jgi:predicted DNA-binding helix-hairpin-helix protein